MIITFKNNPQFIFVYISLCKITNLRTKVLHFHAVNPSSRIFAEKAAQNPKLKLPIKEKAERLKHRNTNKLFVIQDFNN